MNDNCRIRTFYWRAEWSSSPSLSALDDNILLPMLLPIFQQICKSTYSLKFILNEFSYIDKNISAITSLVQKSKRFSKFDTKQKNLFQDLLYLDRQKFYTQQFRYFMEQGSLNPAPLSSRATLQEQKALQKTDEASRILDPNIYDQQIIAVMRQAKLKVELSQKVKAILFQQRAVQEIQDHVKGPYKLKLLQNMHLLKHKISKERIRLNITSKEKELSFLFRQFGLDMALLKLAKNQLEKEATKLPNNQSAQFIKRFQEIEEIFRENGVTELLACLKKANIINQKAISQCITLFEQRNVNQIVTYAQKKYRDQLQKSLNSLLPKPKEEEKQLKHHQLQKEELLKILSQAEITQDQEVNQCFQLYFSNQIQDLITYPSRQFQKQFAESVNKLLIKKQEKLKPEEKQLDVDKELRDILKAAEIQDQEDILRCIELFKINKLSQLKQEPSNLYRQTFGKSIDELLMKMKEVKTKFDNESIPNFEEDFDVKKEFTEVLNVAGIVDEQDVNQCFKLLQEKKIELLLDHPPKDLRTQFEISLKKILDKVQKSQGKAGEVIKQLTIQEQFINILKANNITKQESIKQCLALFKQRQVDEITKFTIRKFRDTLKDSINLLLIKNEKQPSPKKQQCPQKPKIPQKQITKEDSEEYELQKLLYSVNVRQANDVKQCIQLFKEKNYQALKSYPHYSQRVTFSASFDKFLARISQKEDQKPQSLKQQVQDKIRKLLQEVEVKDEEDLKIGLSLYRDNKITELKSFPKFTHRERFAQALDDILANIDKQLANQETKFKLKLLQIFQEAQIREEQQIRICIQFFDSGKIEQLKKFPSFKYRQSFSKSVDQFVAKYSKKEASLEEKLKQVCSKVDLIAEFEICLKLFNEKKYQQLKQMPAYKYKKPFAQEIDKLKEQKSKQNSKILQKKQNSISEILTQCNITQISHQECLKNISEENFQFLALIDYQKRKKFLKEIGNKYSFNKCSMETRILANLTEPLTQNKLLEVILRLKQGKSYKETVPEDIYQKIRLIEEQFQSTLKIRYNHGKSKIFKVNQMCLKNQAKFLQRLVIELTERQIDESVIFLDDSVIQLSQIKWEIKKQYEFSICLKKEYNCKYKNKVRKITLLPQKSFNYNKNYIFAALRKQDLKYQEQEPFSMTKIKLKVEPSNNIQAKDLGQLTLQNLQDEVGGISTILVEILLNVTLYYQDIMQQYELSSQSKLIDLKKIINEKHVPYNSQILYLNQSKESKIEIDQSRDKDCLNQISSKYTITFILANRCSFQFYGFHQNIPLSFSQFSQFFVEHQESTLKMIELCSFSRKKEEELQFIQHFLAYLYSGIKKRFPIQTVIQKFKILVSEIKYESIWNPNTENETIKVNQAFVFAYILKNADSRLRIQLMNLLRENVPIPLYLKQFQNISKVSNEFRLNQQLLWILKQGFTVTSIGLHSQQNIKAELGKSNLLNEIFTTRFEQSQNKHQIIKGVPYIAVRVFQNIYPLHVIDIPHDCSQEITNHILENSNLVLIHSWRSEAETEKEMMRIKETFKLPVICLIRDCKQKNSLKVLKGNYIADEKPQKIINLTQKNNCINQINLLKQEIYKFIAIKNNNCSLSSKIFGLYSKNELYRNFSDLVSSLENKMLNLTPIGDVMEWIKRQQKQKVASTEEKINQKKNQIKEKLSPQLLSIIRFLIKEEVKPYQNLILGLLRQKLKTFQNELNIFYIRIYQYRDDFQKSIKDMTDKEKKEERINRLNQKVAALVQLNPQSISDKKDEQISKIFKGLIDGYQNKIKPKIFSVELFWRELNYLIGVDQNFLIQGLPIINIVKDLKQVDIQSNLPFQIIDGDLLQMPKKLMTRLFQNKQQRAITITILGPQSSGKSTLLNFMFGCDFATSQGRCTRGVYGTYFKFAENKGQFANLTHCQGIFVIDTEGLFAITNDKDKQDEDRKDFDSKLVLFCLAVSDFVVINVRGNFDFNTEKIVRLCHQRLEDLNIQKDKRPQIIVVLNQNASDRIQQSQNEFKQIKKTIEFDLNKSLSLAYQISNYGHEQIGLFGKNQKLTKKYPLEAFLKETTNLMNEILKKILKKRGISKLSQIVEKFQRVWSMVVAFPNLSKSVTNQYRGLDMKIKQWKDNFQDQEKNDLNKLLQQFKENKITQHKILEEIEINQKKLLQIFERDFKEKTSDEQQIKFLKRQQKSKITSKTMVTKANIKYEMQNIRLKKQIRLSKIEGDYMLKEKAKQIFNHQLTQKQNLTDEEKKKRFDECFQQQLKRIQMTTNLGGQILRQYQKIQTDYLFLLREQTNSQRGLPKVQGWFGDQKCPVQQMVRNIKERLVDNHARSYEDVLVYTNKIHTNILKGGNTDASLEYFDMNDYFKVEQIVQYYAISQHDLVSALKKPLIKQFFKQKMQEANKKVDTSTHLRRIWEEINRSLQPVGLKFTKFKEFQEHYNVFQSNFVYKFISNIIKKKEIGYHFFQAHFQRQYKTINFRCSEYGCFCHQKGKYHQRTQVDHQKHRFTPYIYQYSGNHNDKRCICSYKPEQPSDFLLPRFYNHINWINIMNQIKKTDDFKSKQEKVNESLTRQINKELKNLNLEIINSVDWQDFFNSIKTNYSYGNQHHHQSIIFALVNEDNFISSYEKICSLIEQNQYLSAKQFKQGLKKYDQKYGFHQGNIFNIFSVKTKRLEPKQKDGYFKTYLKENKPTIQQLKKTQFKNFIFKELRSNKKNSLDTFYFRIFKIVESVIQKRLKLDKKAYIEIYNKVNQQICKFNNDLNQISCNLSPKYIGYINLAVVYMMWKLIINQKIKQKHEIYQTKLNEYQNQWQLFKARTSNDQQNNVLGDINQFFKQFSNTIKEVINKKKDEYMILQKKNFSSNNSRETIQSLIDIDIFKKETTQQKILEYLENPYKTIDEKYNSCYELSWQNLTFKYSTQRIGFDLLNEFYQLINILEKVFEENQLDDSKKMFSDLFQIIQEEDKALSSQISQEAYQQEGKRVLYEYFIDTLLGQDEKKTRECAKIQVKPIRPLKFLTKASVGLKTLLLELKSIKYLSLTNFVKFVKRLLSPQIRTKFKQQIQKLSELSAKDKQTYINNISVIICNQKCPCCGRICGYQNEHQFHKCLYGHQMRGLNGNYIQRQNGVKQASVIRCQQMAETDIIKYNGKQYSWIEFKDYWKNKNPGSWLFDDATLNNNANEVRFQQAWTIAGPIYCAKKGIKYANYQKADIQKASQTLSPIHYIFALDQSGSMLGNQWEQLKASLKATVQKINVQDQNRNLLKISIIKFDDTANIYCENYNPKQIITNLPCRGGGTNFDPPFNLAATLATKYIASSVVIFIFMTDGGASYPTNGIAALKRLQISYPNKLKYAGIQFNCSASVMKTIATQLKGTTGTAYNPQQLTDLFTKSVQFIEYREGK